MAQGCWGDDTQASGRDFWGAGGGWNWWGWGTLGAKGETQASAVRGGCPTGGGGTQLFRGAGGPKHPAMTPCPIPHVPRRPSPVSLSHVPPHPAGVVTTPQVTSTPPRLGGGTQASGAHVPGGARSGWVTFLGDDACFGGTLSFPWGHTPVWWHLPPWGHFPCAPPPGCIWCLLCPPPPFLVTSPPH